MIWTPLSAVLEMSQSLPGVSAYFARHTITMLVLHAAHIRETRMRRYTLKDTSYFTRLTSAEAPLHLHNDVHFASGDTGFYYAKHWWVDAAVHHLSYSDIDPHSE